MSKEIEFIRNLIQFNEERGADVEHSGKIGVYDSYYGPDKPTDVALGRKEAEDTAQMFYDCANSMKDLLRSMKEHGFKMREVNEQGFTVK